MRLSARGEDRPGVGCVPQRAAKPSHLVYDVLARSLVRWLAHRVPRENRKRARLVGPTLGQQATGPLKGQPRMAVQDGPG